MKKNLKKAMAATLATAMVMGGSMTTFAETTSPEAVSGSGIDNKIEKLLNKQVYHVKLPTSTYVTNHFSKMKFDPQGVIAETKGDLYKGVSGTSISFESVSALTKGSVLFVKDIDTTQSGATVTVNAITYSTVSATLEAVNCGTVPITVHALTTVKNLDSGKDKKGNKKTLKLSESATFSTTEAALYLAVTGDSTSSSPATNVALSGTGATGKAKIVKAVTGAPATAYAVTTVAAGAGKKDYKYAPASDVLTNVAATDEGKVDQLPTAVSGKAINTKHAAFSKFTFVMTGKANPDADYQAWKDYGVINLGMDIVWNIEYDKNAESRQSMTFDNADDAVLEMTEASNGNIIYTWTTGAPTGSLTSLTINDRARQGVIDNNNAFYKADVSRFIIQAAAAQNVFVSGDNTIQATIGGQTYTFKYTK